jgi:protease-4|tara:strand:- start:596 stop:1549 length:954 start_codon:yes stop_codon:yes gene_type:complete
MIDKSEKSNSDEFANSLASEFAKEALKEQRRSRRWGIFFKLVVAAYIAAFFVIYIYENNNIRSFSPQKHTAVIEINGIISTETVANADFIITGLRNAYEDENTQGIILRINSPGGSPVQAGYVNDEINRLREKHPDIPVFAVITDICTSGGYYIAVAADKIFANKASIVGSIGVVMSSFGFVDAIEKLGIERRLLFSGESKALMDPFMPLDFFEQKHMQEILEKIHQQFISVVRDGRGENIHNQYEEELFSGLIWSGEESVKLGLIDGLASTSEVARDIIGNEYIVNYTKRDNYFDRFAKQVGASLFYNFKHSMITQ